MNGRKYLTLAALVFCASIGGVLLKHGMNEIGAITGETWHRAFTAIFHPSVALGIILLIVFFASYLNALSWADLTFVLPATGLGYVVIALLSVFTLGENIPLTRWIGIALIVAGVGFVTAGPSVTQHEKVEAAEEALSGSRAAHEAAEELER